MPASPRPGGTQEKTQKHPIHGGVLGAPGGSIVFQSQRTSQQPDSKFSGFESMELLGVFPCPWVTVICFKIVHYVHCEHCFHGVCSTTAVRTRGLKSSKLGIMNEGFADPYPSRITIVNAGDSFNRNGF